VLFPDSLHEAQVLEELITVFSFTSKTEMLCVLNFLFRCLTGCRVVEENVQTFEAGSTYDYCKKIYCIFETEHNHDFIIVMLF
jgi:hypothetical protein